MSINNRKPVNAFGTEIGVSRRNFLKYTAAAGVGLCAAASPVMSMANSLSSRQYHNPIEKSSLGYTGARKDPFTGHYGLGNGYRSYNPAIMRFHSSDSMSPFGKGGINSYAYCLGDPVNMRDPSGHFALMSILIGMLVGAIIGAIVSSIAEGITCSVQGRKFDWRQPLIGAGLGALGGAFGGAAIGATAGAQVGLAFGQAAATGAADFGIQMAMGVPAKEAGINAATGAGIGLLTFGAGKAIGRVGGRAIAKFGAPRLRAVGKPSGAGQSIGGEMLGADFILHKANAAGGTSKNLILTAHGSASGALDFQVPGINVKYYGPHGATLMNPGIASVAKGAVKTHSTSRWWQPTRNYVLRNFEGDNKWLTSLATREGSDIVSVRPGVSTTTGELFSTLRRSGYSYDTLSYVACRTDRVGAPLYYPQRIAMA